jgi:hypothetical protein
MNTPVKQYSLQFNADGVSTSMAIDCSTVPINENFVGNLPQAVLTPQVTFSNPVTGQSSPLTGVTAALSGTTVTLTFTSPPARYDNNSVLIVYTATFSLQYGD